MLTSIMLLGCIMSGAPDKRKQQKKQQRTDERFLKQL